MRKFSRLCLVTFALMGLLAQRASAVPVTNFLNGASNLLAQAYDVTAGIPKVHTLLGKALNDFQKPSTSVAGDFNIFLAAAQHLMPLQRMPGSEILSGTLGGVLSNAFTNFMMEAVVEIMQAGTRLAAISDFQPQKRQAVAQLNQAMNALNVVTTTDNLQIGMLSVRLAFMRIGTAMKLLAAAEAKPGLARNSLVGQALEHTQRGEMGTVQLIDALNYDSTDGPGTYEYTRTGLNSGKLVLHGASGAETTVTMICKSSTRGTFKFVHVSDHTTRGSGTFTLTALP